MRVVGDGVYGGRGSRILFLKFIKHFYILLYEMFYMNKVLID